MKTRSPLVIGLLSSILLTASAVAQTPGAALSVVSRVPENNAKAAFPDTQLHLIFNSAPTLGTSGQVRIYDASNNTLVDTVDLGVAPNQQDYLIGGIEFYAYPVLINGNEAIIYPHNNLLAYNKTYYVQMDPGVLTDGTKPFPGFSGNTAWVFTTKASGPAAGASRVVVAADGTGDFATVQGAVDFVPANNTNRVTIFIRKGVYTEIVSINSKPNITFLGEDRVFTVVGYPNSNNLNPTSSTRASMQSVRSTGIQLVNFTIRNSTRKGGSQAEAIIFKSNSQVMLSNMNLYSYQDTLQISCPGYTQDTHIEGDTDFLWGTGANFFTNCTFLNLTSRAYFAQVRNTAANHGYVFLNCKFDTAPGTSGIYLNRIAPDMFPYCEMVLINCALGPGINPAGWLLNNASDASDLSNLHFWEVNSTNISDGQPIDASQRAPFSKQLSLTNEPMTVKNYSDPTYVLGGWTPAMAPIILTQPDAQSATAGQPVTLSATVAAVPAATYQWSKNGAPIAGATKATLKLSSATTADGGTYTVTATNSNGAATSSPAVLTVR